MPNPIEIEQRYHELNAELKGVSSVRYARHLGMDFIRSLDGSFSEYGSYIVQVLEELPNFLHPLAWSGLNPHDLREEIDFLKKVDRALSSSYSNREPEATIRHLQEISLLLYACMNDTLETERILQAVCGFDLHLPQEKAIPENGTHLIQNLEETLLNLMDQETKLGAAAKKSFQNVLGQLDLLVTEDAFSTLIPVVEEYDDVKYGRLRKLKMDLFGETEGEDKLVRNIRLQGSEVPADHQKTAMLRAARSLFQSEASNAGESYFKGSIHFEMTGPVHSGNSGDLAIGALWYTCLFVATERRERFSIGNRVAITGDLDGNRNVRPVDEETIRQKAEAAFFSWAGVLVVPESQRRLFERELAMLQRRFPLRNLDVVGVRKLEEIFYDRRVAHHDIQGRITYLYNRAKSERYRTASTAIIAMLLVVIGWFLFGPFDPNPVVAEFSGESMILKNQYGREVNSFRVGERVVEMENIEPIHPNKHRLVDINSDGVNEVFFARQISGNQEINAEELIAYSVSGDSLIWVHQFDYALPFLRSNDIEFNSYLLYSINVLNEGTQKPDSYVIANIGHSRFFPSLILKLRIDDGSEVSRYLHVGRVHQTALEDVDEDGNEEILALGQNNAFDENVVFFVLEADQLSGHSPLSPEYTITGMERADELAYVRIPQTIVGRAFRKRVMSNNPVHMQTDQSQRLITLRINDFMLPEESMYEAPYAPIFYRFDFDFQLRSIGTGSYYDLWAKNLFEEGRIPFEPDQVYLEAFRDSVMYWRGGEFVYDGE